MMNTPNNVNDPSNTPASPASTGPGPFIAPSAPATKPRTSFFAKLKHFFFG